jgi:Holliday junction DNA helicase RuvA
MIASVAGKVGARCPDHVVIESGGVGYRLNVSAQTLATVPAVGGDARLHSHLVMRDDALHLYGFATEEERDLFLKLVSVAGVGPKMALAVLSGSSAREVSKAIALGDSKRFQVVPGVGKRTAERVIVELREKISDDLIVAEAGAVSEDPRVLAREGLVGLGYDAAEAERMLDSVALSEEEREPEELIAAALRTAVKGR